MYKSGDRVYLTDEGFDVYYVPVEYQDKEFYVYWCDDHPRAKVIVCEVYIYHERWWTPKENASNSLPYGVPDENTCISETFFDEYFVRKPVNNTKLARKMYPDAPEKDGLLLI